MNMKKYFVIFTLIFIALLLIQNASAQESQAETIKNELIQVRAAMDDLSASGFNVDRYNDTLIIAEQQFEKIYSVEQNTSEEQDYSVVIGSLNDLYKIQSLSYFANDELGALRIEIDSLEDINKSEVEMLYKQAKSEFYAERYEQSLDKIDETYDKISEIQSVQAKAKIFYDATSKTIWNFIQIYWRELLVFFGIFGLIVTVSYKSVNIHLLKRRLDLLKIRKVVLKDMIADIQKRYFERGAISESTYRIKIEKFSELIRDINRQIPLIKERLVILGVGITEIPNQKIVKKGIWTTKEEEKKRTMKKKVYGKKIEPSTKVVFKKVPSIKMMVVDKPQPIKKKMAVKQKVAKKKVVKKFKKKVKKIEKKEIKKKIAKKKTKKKKQYHKVYYNKTLKRLKEIRKLLE